MKFMLITILFFSADAQAFNIFGGDEDFTKNTFVGKPFSAVKTKYPGVEATDCEPENVSQCKKKGMTCKCYILRMARQRDRSESMYFVTANENVVMSLHGRSNSPEMAKIYMPKVSEFSGDVKPETIFEDADDSGFRLMRLRWKFKNANATAHVWCPLEISGGKIQMKTKIRDCYLRRSITSQITDFSDMTGKAVKVEY